MKKEQNLENSTEQALTIPVVRQRFLIYADDYITWNKDINDWNHSAEFTGTYLDAHEYARILYGKKYTLNGA
jgi:hypothetical protein